MWSGRDNLDSILNLLTHVPIGDFYDTYVNYFQSVEQALASGGLAAYEAILDCYTGLLQHWAISAKSKAAGQDPVEGTVFEDLARHVSTLSLSLLLSAPVGHCQPLISSILCFYEVLSSISEPHIIPVMLAPMHLMYLLTLHASSTTVSRTCGIVTSYKTAFDPPHPTPIRKYYPKTVTDDLNWCMRDMYYMLWYSRGLEITEDKATSEIKTRGLYCDPALRDRLGEYLRSVDRDYDIGVSLDLSHHPCIASMAASAWRAMEDAVIEEQGYDRSTIRYHSGPVTQKSLSVLRRNGGVDVVLDKAHGYKIFAVKWLAERGLGGLRDVIFATRPDLKS